MSQAFAMSDCKATSAMISSWPSCMMSSFSREVVRHKPRMLLNPARTDRGAQEAPIPTRSAAAAIWRGNDPTGVSCWYACKCVVLTHHTGGDRHPVLLRGHPAIHRAATAPWSPPPSRVPTAAAADTGSTSPRCRHAPAIPPTPHHLSRHAPCSGHRRRQQHTHPSSGAAGTTHRPTPA